MKHGLRLGCSLVTLMALGCEGGGFTEAGSQVQFAFTATSTAPSFAAVRSADAAVNVERAWITVSALELEPCSADAAPIAIPDDYPLDLAHDPPNQAVFESLVTEYCRLSVALAPPKDDAPEPIAERTVHVEGTRADGVPFNIEASFERAFELARSPSTRAFEGLKFAVGVDLARWFDGVDLDAAELSADEDVAVIRDDSNPAILAAFEANTTASFALYVDADGDGVLDGDELVPIAEAR